MVRIGWTYLLLLLASLSFAQKAEFAVIKQGTFINEPWTFELRLFDADLLDDIPNVSLPQQSNDFYNFKIVSSKVENKKEYVVLQKLEATPIKNNGELLLPVCRFDVLLKGKLIENPITGKSDIASKPTKLALSTGKKQVEVSLKNIENAFFEEVAFQLDTFLHIYNEEPIGITIFVKGATSIPTDALALTTHNIRILNYTIRKSPQGYELNYLFEPKSNADGSIQLKPIFIVPASRFVTLPSIHIVNGRLRDNSHLKNSLTYDKVYHDNLKWVNFGLVCIIFLLLVLLANRYKVNQQITQFIRYNYLLLKVKMGKNISTEIGKRLLERPDIWNQKVTQAYFKSRYKSEKNLDKQKMLKLLKLLFS